MTDMELAKEIERRRGGTDMLNNVLMPHQWDQIIAALRRGTEHDTIVRYDHLGIGHLTKRPPSGEMVPEDEWTIQRNGNTSTAIRKKDGWALAQVTNCGDGVFNGVTDGTEAGRAAYAELCKLSAAEAEGRKG